MNIIRRIPRPSRRNSIIAAALLALLFSAYTVGNTFIPDERPIILSGFSYSRSEVGEAVRLASDVSEAVAATVAAEAASTAADSAKAASASSHTVWFEVGSTGEAEFEVGDAAELYAERLVVFTARIELEVEDLESAIDAVRLLAESHGGFVATEKTRSESGFITVRVPQRVFHDAVAKIEEMGVVQSRDLQGEDVTEEYVDLEAQLTNLEKQEQRLLEIMEMGTTVESVLKVEKELERVRGRIESTKGRMNYLESRVELATITVYLNLEEEEPEIQFAWFPEVDWSVPVKAGFSVLFSVAQGMITMTIVVGPFVALGYAGVRGYRHLKTRNTSLVDAQAEEQSPT
jgi:hypothetical protein